MIIKTLEPLSEINLKKIEDATGIKPEYVSRENISDETLGCADVIITRDRDFKSALLKSCGVFDMDMKVAWSHPLKCFSRHLKLEYTSLFTICKKSIICKNVLSIR